MVATGVSCMTCLSWITWSCHVSHGSPQFFIPLTIFLHDLWFLHHQSTARCYNVNIVQQGCLLCELYSTICNNLVCVYGGGGGKVMRGVEVRLYAVGISIV